jgi:DNA primase
MNIDPSTTKYLVRIKITADGVIEKPDVVGAIFGQTEGLLGEELDLRDLQKSGRMGRIEVETTSNKGKTEGEILLPSSLDQVETAILASALETIDRVGPCKAKLEIVGIEDVREVKKQKIVERAKDLLNRLMEESKTAGIGLIDSVRQAVQVEEITTYGPDKCPAGPNIADSDAIIIVEGRSDVLNLLKYGIKNAIAVEGTNVPKTIQNLSREKTVTAFVDGDRGGELILKELLQVAEVDFITRAPRAKEVEELSQKQIMKCLKNKVPAEQFVELYGVGGEGNNHGPPRGEDTDKTVQKGVDVKPRKFPFLPKPKFEQLEKIKKEGLPQAIATSQRPLKNLSPQQIKYRETLTQLAGTSKGKLLDNSGAVIQEAPVRELVDVLKSQPRDSLSAIVFDGMITQRLLDVAAENNVKTVVGIKTVNVSKLPTSVEVITKADLE